MTAWWDEDAGEDSERCVEPAYGIALSFCDQCDMPHLYLKDEHGECFAMLNIDIDSGRQLVKQLTAMLELIADPEGQRAEGKRLLEQRVSAKN